MMTLDEIYILNSALDGEDIIGLPSFGMLRNKKGMFGGIDILKASLINKGILEDENKFTDQGIVETKKLSLYKTASRYVTLQGVTIAIHGLNGIMLCKEENGYNFTVVNPKETYEEMLELYPFINDNSPDEEADGSYKAMEGRELYNLYYMKSKSGFAVQLKSVEENCTELYFTYNNEIYRYSCDLKRLYKVSGHDIRTKLQTYYLRVGGE